MLLRACEPAAFSFPRDHGRHPEFRTEWWYLCGHLRSDEGNEYAYHFTVFRRAMERWRDLAVVAMAIGSRAIRNIPAFQRCLARMLENQNCRRISVDGYVGHLAITNMADRKYVFFERAGTSLFRMAGAREDGLGVWVKQWKLEEDNARVRLFAERDAFSVDLELHASKTPILHGDNGLSLKGDEPGQASYHYSVSSLRTAGHLQWQGKRLHVAGTSLMDREFGTAMLPRTVKGWDWFALTLDNDHEIMISLIRHADDSIAHTSSAAIVFPDGSWQCLAADSLHLHAGEFWTSSVTAARYPVQWTLRTDIGQVQLDIRAVIEAHELVSASSTTIDYWEGPVRVFGTMEGVSVAGNGHVELVGYAQYAGGKF
jgi:predicted secreted hydrolase